MPRYIVTATIQTTMLDDDGSPTDPPVDVSYYTGDSLPLALAALLSAATDGERPTPQIGWTAPRTLDVRMRVQTDEEARALDDRDAHINRLRAELTGTAPGSTADPA